MVDPRADGLRLRDVDHRAKARLRADRGQASAYVPAQPDRLPPRRGDRRAARTLERDAVGKALRARCGGGLLFALFAAELLGGAAADGALLGEAAVAAAVWDDVVRLLRVE